MPSKCKFVYQGKICLPTHNFVYQLINLFTNTSICLFTHQIVHHLKFALVTLSICCAFFSFLFTIFPTIWFQVTLTSTMETWSWFWHYCGHSLLTTNWELPIFHPRNWCWHGLGWVKLTICLQFVYNLFFSEYNFLAFLYFLDYFNHLFTSVTFVYKLNICL